MVERVGDVRTTCPVEAFSSRSSEDVVDTATTLELGDVFENVVGVAIGLTGRQLTRFKYCQTLLTHPQYH